MKRLRERRLDEATDVELYNKLKKQYPNSSALSLKVVKLVALLDPETLERDGLISRCGTNTVVLLQWLAGKPSKWQQHLQAVLPSARKREELGKALMDFKRYQQQVKDMRLPTALQDFREPEKFMQLTKLLRLTAARPEVPAARQQRHQVQKGKKSVDPRKYGYEWARNQDWALYSPFTFEGSKVLAKPATWCTGRTQAQYNSYKNRGGLFILQSLNDQQLKYQLSNTESRATDFIYFNDVSNTQVATTHEGLKKYCEEDLKDPELYTWFEKCFTGGEWYERLMEDQAGLEAEQAEKLAAEKAELQAAKSGEPRAAKKVSQEVLNFREFVNTVATTDISLLAARLQADPYFLTLVAGQPFWSTRAFNPEFLLASAFEIPWEAMRAPTLLERNRWVLHLMNADSEYWDTQGLDAGKTGVIEVDNTDGFLPIFQAGLQKLKARETDKIRAQVYEEVRLAIERKFDSITSRLNKRKNGASLVLSAQWMLSAFRQPFIGSVNVGTHSNFYVQLPFQIFSRPKYVKAAEALHRVWQKRAAALQSCADGVTDTGLVFNPRPLRLWTELVIRMAYYGWFVEGLGELFRRAEGLRRKISDDLDAEQRTAIEGNINNLDAQVRWVYLLGDNAEARYRGNQVLKDTSALPASQAELASLTRDSAQDCQQHLKRLLRDENGVYALQKFMLEFKKADGSLPSDFQAGLSKTKRIVTAEFAQLKQEEDATTMLLGAEIIADVAGDLCEGIKTAVESLIEGPGDAD